MARNQSAAHFHACERRVSPWGTTYARRDRRHELRNMFLGAFPAPFVQARENTAELVFRVCYGAFVAF